MLNLQKLALLIDFGSTYTKLTLVNPIEAVIVATLKLPTSSQEGLYLCYKKGKEKLLNKIGGKNQLPVEEYFCSSAWGGFKMVAIGLTESLTTEAAKRAALGAGSRILKTYCYRLTLDQITEIYQLKPDVILLTGGCNGGNLEIICYNACLLAQLPSDIAIIVAGNEAATAQLSATFKNRANVFYTENVMPQINMLNPDPVRKIVQKVFLKKIIHSKGLNQVAPYSNKPVIPTPTAVLTAAKLLKEGTKTCSGLGDLIIVDIGGATTDVHSVGSGLFQSDDVFFEGLAEPYLKRTVEGDLGMRSSAESLLEQLLSSSEIKEDLLPENISALRSACHYRCTHPTFVPKTKIEIDFDQFLAEASMTFALKRHAGVKRAVQTPTRTLYYQKGKNLQHFNTIIATGGVVVHSQHPEEIVKNELLPVDDALLPINPKRYVDQDYLLSAMGLLSQKYPEAALTILKKSLRRL